MKFQLVLQWPTSPATDFDDFIEMESELLDHLDESELVDGHDMGSGQMNIFISTDEPHETLQRAQEILGDFKIWPEVRVAYRDTAGGEYTIMWPADLEHFSVS